MEIQLKDLRPQMSEVEIGGKTYRLRKLNLDDEAWLRETFGENVDNSFGTSMTWEQYARIAFHQMVNEDKKKFTPEEIEFVSDDTGESIKKMIGGWSLFRLKVSGVNEKLAVARAVMETLGISRPIWDKILQEEEQKNRDKEAADLKAKGFDVKKKKSTGRKSLNV